MANDDKTTEITSIAPDHLELFKAYLTYRDVKQQLRKYKKQPRYKIKIELSVISSNSEEWSNEDLTSENETDEQTEPEFTDDDVQKDDDDVQKDTEDVENSLKK